MHDRKVTQVEVTKINVNKRYAKNRVLKIFISEQN